MTLSNVSLVLSVATVATAISGLVVGWIQRRTTAAEGKKNAAAVRIAELGTKKVTGVTVKEFLEVFDASSRARDERTFRQNVELALGPGVVFLVAGAVIAHFWK